MTVRVYRSTDASAPALTNAVGTLITLLDACLVNGYGANAAAGWTKAFTGTNRASYRQGTGSNGFYLDVTDTTTVSSVVRGYESMTAVNVGTNPFPTVAQSTNYYILKSSISTAAGWILIASEKIFYLWVNPIITTLYTSSSSQITCFGDIISRKTGDLYATTLIGNSTTAQSSNEFGIYRSSVTDSASTWMARSHTGTAGSIRTINVSHSAKQHTSSPWNNIGIDPITKNHNLSPIWVFEQATTVDRGVLPGVYKFIMNNPPNMLTNAQGVQIQGTGSLTGKTFEILQSYRATDSLIGMAFEISDTW